MVSGGVEHAEKQVAPGSARVLADCRVGEEKALPKGFWEDDEGLERIRAVVGHLVENGLATRGGLQGGRPVRAGLHGISWEILPLEGGVSDPASSSPR